VPGRERADSSSPPGRRATTSSAARRARGRSTWRRARASSSRRPPVDAPGPLVAALLAGAVPLEGVETAASVDGQQARTQLTYETDEGAPTVVVAPPHVGLPDGAEVVGTVPSLLGDLRLLAGSVLETSVPVTEPQTRLDLDGLSDEDRATVVERLRQDVDTLDFPSPDSYHGGKEVQRAATLYELALTLGEDALAEEVKGPLVEQLDLWFDPSGCRERQERCFTYDTTLGGMLARQPSYGSDELNDHHFHYGHLLYAAGVLAQADPDLVERWEKVADLVAADIASPQATALFPAHRPFDPWYGHSWASGTAPFADGNNQESSSEAVNGWAGATLWATARGDDELSDTARWMLSNETAATLAYWIDPGLDAAYGAPSVSLNWQGKREFATWFSPEPSAIVGIQLIPMAPTQVGYLGSDPEAVADMVAAAGDLTPGRPLVDQVLMAQSIVDPGSARATLTAFGRDDIDPGTSWSYLTALVLSR
jgi:endo-1,3(4)-beta-glucanase